MRTVRSRLKMSVLGAASLCFTFIIATMTPASAESNYQVAWTGIGIYPREAPSMDAARVEWALPDGATVSIVCETLGQEVSNGYNVTPIWEKLSDGTYLPNAFINTGVDGWTPGVPRCEPEPDVRTQYAERVEGIFLSTEGDSTAPPLQQTWNKLLTHYYGKSGSPVQLDWRFFTENQAFVDWARQLPLDGSRELYYSTRDVDGFNMWASLGTFTVWRTSENCFVMRDVYDFDTDAWTFGPALDAKTGAGVPFEINASGCM